MDLEELKILLSDIKCGNITLDEGVDKLKDLPFKDLGFAKIDNHREIRVGYPEVIYCEGKTIEQVKNIVECMLETGNNILGTRASFAMYLAVKKICIDAEYNDMAKTIVVKRKERKIPDTYIAVVTGGTSDMHVAEEAVITADVLGNRVERIYDVGVAGIHRLFNSIDLIRGARVVIVIAGMEGALASVLGGLVDKPIIAVPTSIGYGANFGGISALLSGIVVLVG